MNSLSLKGCIIDIDSTQKEFLHDKWWNMLEKIYKHKSCALGGENFDFDHNEKKMYDVTKNTLLKYNTWGVFIHYLCYDGECNIWTKHTFFEHLESINLDQFLRVSSYIPMTRFVYLDSLIINEFVCEKSDHLFIGYEEYETGKSSLICNNIRTTTHTNIKDMVIDLLGNLEFDVNAIKSMHFTIIPNYIAELCALFLPMDVNERFLRNVMNKNMVLRRIIDDVFQFILPQKNEHYILHRLFRFMNEKYDIIFTE